MLSRSLINNNKLNHIAKQCKYNVISYRTYSKNSYDYDYSNLHIYGVCTSMIIGGVIGSFTDDNIFMKPNMIYGIAVGFLFGIGIPIVFPILFINLSYRVFIEDRKNSVFDPTIVEGIIE